MENEDLNKIYEFIKNQSFVELKDIDVYDLQSDEYFTLHDFDGDVHYFGRKHNGN